MWKKAYSENFLSERYYIGYGKFIPEIWFWKTYLEYILYDSKISLWKSYSGNPISEKTKYSGISNLKFTFTSCKMTILKITFAIFLTLMLKWKNPYPHVGDYDTSTFTNPEFLLSYKKQPYLNGNPTKHGLKGGGNKWEW